MGSFSWMKADRLTKTGNILYDEPYKLLIPKEFGGGFIKDYYEGYGIINSKNGRHDMYELLAFWNHEQVRKLNTSKCLKWNNLDETGFNMPSLKKIDDCTDDNRNIGISLAYSGITLKYPLKLVSVRNTQTYEECEGVSVDDPNQGCDKYTWEDYDEDKINGIIL